jgi:glycerol-3-phosphate dehydrogenase (NAD(P)+)
MADQVAVVNAGAWGTTLAIMLARAGHQVRLWCRRADLADEMRQTRHNAAYVPGVELPPEILPTARLEEALDSAAALLLAPISRAMRDTAIAVAPFVSSTMPVLHASKGLELGSLSRLSEVIADELGRSPANVAVLSGPNLAENVARGLPAAAVVACGDAEITARFQALLHGPTFRVYTSTDVVGVELCGALKNVVALATGAADGLGLGENTRAALITRSLAEIGRLVQAAGGDQRTVAGLAGLGDMVLTCTSEHSRNHWAGQQIARGRSLDEVLASTRSVVEGVPAARAAVALAERYGVDLPVCTQVDQVLHHGAAVEEVLGRLMSREATAELD